MELEKISGADMQARIKAKVEALRQTESITTDPGTTCPYKKCDGSGWIMIGESLDAIECRCSIERRKQRHVARLFDQSCIPDGYLTMEFANYDANLQQHAYRFAKRYTDTFDTTKDKPKNGLALIGSTGTGKSHLAMAIINQLLSEGHQCVVGLVPELMDSLRPGSTQQGVANQRLELLKTAELVLLDDLGAEKQSAWTEERMMIIVHARWANHRPTLITSNIRLEHMEKQSIQWQRMVSRIMQYSYPIQMIGDDYRKIQR